MLKKFQSSTATATAKSKKQFGNLRGLLPISSSRTSNRRPPPQQLARGRHHPPASTSVRPKPRLPFAAPTRPRVGSLHRDLPPTQGPALPPGESRPSQSPASAPYPEICHQPGALRYRKSQPSRSSRKNQARRMDQRNLLPPRTRTRITQRSQVRQTN